MAIKETNKLIVQRLIPATTDCVLFTNPDTDTTTIIKTLIVCNTTGASKTYSLWHNPNGTVSGDQYALIKGMTIAANASDQRIYSTDSGLILTGSASLIVAASVANALTFTLYGLQVVET